MYKPTQILTKRIFVEDAPVKQWEIMKCVKSKPTIFVLYVNVCLKKSLVYSKYENLWEVPHFVKLTPAFEKLQLSQIIESVGKAPFFIPTLILWLISCSMAHLEVSKCVSLPRNQQF